jgi:hypothetical protein
VDETFLQHTDFAQPVVFACFDETLLFVVGHIVEAASLCGVNLQEAAFDAGVLVEAWGGVGPVARASGDVVRSSSSCGPGW